MSENNQSSFYTAICHQFKKKNVDFEKRLNLSDRQLADKSLHQMNSYLSEDYLCTLLTQNK